MVCDTNCVGREVEVKGVECTVWLVLPKEQQGTYTGIRGCSM